MKRSLGTLLALAVVASVLMSATPAAADPSRCGGRDDGLDRLVENLAKVLVLELARGLSRDMARDQYGYHQPSPYPGGYGGYQPAPTYAQPMVIYEQPQYQEGLGPVIVMPRQNTMGYFRQVSPGYYTIDRSPPLRLPPGARVLRPWVEGRTGVTLHLGR